MWRLVVLLTACGHAAEPPRDAAPKLAVVAAPAPSPPAVSSRRMHTTWSNVMSPRDTCFYFSGPRGRDTQLVGDAVLERDGDKVTLKWGNATFTGTYRDSVLDLQRRSTHSYSGQWTTTEVIKGEWKAETGTVSAKYRYEECEQNTTCPGPCHIEADLDLGAI